MDSSRATSLKDLRVASRLSTSCEEKVGIVHVDQSDSRNALFCILCVSHKPCRTLYERWRQIRPQTDSGTSSRETPRAASELMRFLQQVFSPQGIHVVMPMSESKCHKHACFGFANNSLVVFFCMMRSAPLPRLLPVATESRSWKVDYVWAASWQRR